ncbi:hypothetical protein [Salinisphaera aquimarina]|uniref:Uncharacterized protein n=1 Tax=Salinisphaera aquimarina TaxID=2094031 RepID=A0ABV7EQ14_9GAMM
MADLISTTTTAIQLVSRLREVNKNIANAEFNNLIADLSIELANMKVQVAGLIEEHDSLRRQLSSKNNPELTFKEFAYYSEDGDGPFCPGCYDSDGKKVRLAKFSGAFKTFGSHNCPVCKAAFGGT